MIFDYAFDYAEDEFMMLEEQHQIEEKYHLKDLEVPITYYDAKKEE